MRNTKLRYTVSSIASLANEALDAGVEPLALAISLRSIADQLDRLAAQLEAKEAADEQKESEVKDDEQPDV